jgi:hypothetical protein
VCTTPWHLCMLLQLLGWCADGVQMVVSLHTCDCLTPCCRLCAGWDLVQAVGCMLDAHYTWRPHYLAQGHCTQHHPALTTAHRQAALLMTDGSPGLQATRACIARFAREWQPSVQPIPHVPAPATPVTHSTGLDLSSAVQQTPRHCASDVSHSTGQVVAPAIQQQGGLGSSLMHAHHWMSHCGLVAAGRMVCTASQGSALSLCKAVVSARLSFGDIWPRWRGTTLHIGLVIYSFVTRLGWHSV